MRKSLKYFLLVIGFISLSAGLLIYRHEQLIFDEPLIPELAFLDGKAEKEPMNQRQTSLIEKGRQAGEIVAQWSNEVTVSDDEQALSNFDLCKDPNPSDAVILRRLLAVNAEALDDFYNLMKFPMIAHLEEPKMGNPPIFPGRLRNTLRLIRAESCLLAFEKKPIETAFKSLLDLDQFIHTSLTQNTTLSFLEAAIGVRILKENREQLNRMEEFDRVSKALPALRLKFEQNQIDRNELLMKIRQHELLVF